MKKGAFVLLAVLAFGLVCCKKKDEGGGGPGIPADLIGQWLDANGTFGYEFTSDGKISQIIQGKVMPAGSVTTVIPPDNDRPGRIEINVEYTGSVAYTIEGDTLIFSNASSTWWATSYAYTKKAHEAP
jgi:hypothetical protein